MDDAAAFAHRKNGGRTLPRPCQIGIAVVFEDEHAMRVRELELDGIRYLAATVPLPNAQGQRIGRLVAFRSLADLGYSEAQVKAFAAEYTVQDGPNADGEMFERPGIPSDHFPSPFPNVEAAAASNNGAAPPDFSLIAKARGVERGFPTFVFDIFTQYAEAARTISMRC